MKHLTVAQNAAQQLSPLLLTIASHTFVDRFYYTGWAKKVSPKQFTFMMLITRHVRKKH